jgi:phosphoglycolate phosphatase
MTAYPNLFMYKNIIWDWNGTILNDSWLNVEVVNILLKERGLPVISSKVYADSFVFPVEDFYTFLGIGLTKESFSDLSDQFAKLYNARIHECEVRKDVLSLIVELNSAGICQYILSATKQDSLESAVKHFGLSRYFLSIMGLGDNSASNKVGLGTQLIRENNLNTTETLIIGDTIHDHQVADSLGVDCILIPSGYQGLSRLQSTGAMVCADVAQIKQNCLWAQDCGSHMPNQVNIIE